MGLEKNNFQGEIFARIISDGSIRVKSREGVEEAVRRDYELKDGTKGYKWELVYSTLSGLIDKLEFQDSDYGENLNITIDGIVLSVGVGDSYGQDLMKKLPNADFTKKIIVAPYSFMDDEGKNRKGITLYQDKQKLRSYFHGKNEAGEWEALNDYPVPDGDTEFYKKNDWKIFYLKVEKFLIDYTQKQIIPKLSAALAKTPLTDKEDKFPEEIPASNEGEGMEVPF